MKIGEKEYLRIRHKLGLGLRLFCSMGKEIFLIIKHKQNADKQTIIVQLYIKT